MCTLLEKKIGDMQKLSRDGRESKLNRFKSVAFQPELSMLTDCSPAPLATGTKQMCTSNRNVIQIKL